MKISIEMTVGEGKEFMTQEHNNLPHGIGHLEVLPVPVVEVFITFIYSENLSLVESILILWLWWVDLVP
jgi:hypothetical protein